MWALAWGESSCGPSILHQLTWCWYVRLISRLSLFLFLVTCQWRTETQANPTPSYQLSSMFWIQSLKTERKVPTANSPWMLWTWCAYIHSPQLLYFTWLHSCVFSLLLDKQHVELQQSTSHRQANAKLLCQYTSDKILIKPLIDLMLLTDSYLPSCLITCRSHLHATWKLLWPLSAGWLWQDRVRTALTQTTMTRCCRLPSLWCRTCPLKECTFLLKCWAKM